jgi:hypothetical protein
MKQTRKARIVVEEHADGFYFWNFYSPNGRLIAEGAKTFDSEREAVKYFEALAAKGVIGNAVVVAG